MNQKTYFFLSCLFLSAHLFADCPTENNKAKKLRTTNSNIVLAEVDQKGNFHWCIKPSVRSKLPLSKMAGIVLTKRNNLVLTTEGKIYSKEYWFGLPYKTKKQKITLGWLKKQLKNKSGVYQIKLNNEGCHSHHGYKSCHLEVIEVVPLGPMAMPPPDNPSIVEPPPLPTMVSPDITPIPSITPVVIGKETIKEPEFNFLIIIIPAVIIFLILVLLAIKYYSKPKNKIPQERKEPSLSTDSLDDSIFLDEDNKTNKPDDINWI